MPRSAALAGAPCALRPSLVHLKPTRELSCISSSDYARSAGIVALFVVAAIARRRERRALRLCAATCRRSRRSTTTHRTRSRASSPPNGQVIGEFATERRVDHRLRRHRAASAPGDHRRRGRRLRSPFRLEHLEPSPSRPARDCSRPSRTVSPAGPSDGRPAPARSRSSWPAISFRKRSGSGSGDLSLERKIKEAIVAMQIEKRYTKREILTFYANHMHLGHGTYGVEAAARLYFGKSAQDVTLEEAALLAGIFQSPARQSPFVNMDAAVRRRNYALQRMADEGFITQAEADAAKTEADRRPRTAAQQQARSIAPYFVEEVRKHLEQRVRRQSAVRKRPVRDDDARRQAAGGGRSARVDARAAAARQAARVPPAATQRRSPKASTIEAFKDDRWISCHRAPATSSRPSSSAVGKPAPPAPRDCGSGAITPTDRDGFAWTQPGVGRGPVQGRRRHRGRDQEDRSTRPSGRRGARADPARRRGAHRDREPDGPDQGDGRRLGLQPQQVQPRRAGVPPARIDVQADRLHGGRSIAGSRRPRSSSTRRSATRPATARSTAPQNYDHKFEGPVTLRRCARAVAQHSGDPDDGNARARRACWPTPDGSASSRSFPPYLPDRARRRRRHAARGDERLHRVSQPGRADEADSRS